MGLGLFEFQSERNIACFNLALDVRLVYLR